MLFAFGCVLAYPLPQVIGPEKICHVLCMLKNFKPWSSIFISLHGFDHSTFCQFLFSQELFDRKGSLLGVLVLHGERGVRQVLGDHVVEGVTQ